MASSAPVSPLSPNLTVTFVLNGASVTVTTESDRSLLSVLREDFGITSPKNGCEPIGQCGCCTVLVDGQPRLSCAIKIDQVAGREIQTMEGLPRDLRDQLAASFQQTGGCQCGFCIPGIAMRCVALVRDNPRPTREEIVHALRWHFCRCTGYTKIIEAIELFAAARRGESLLQSPKTCTGSIGSRLPRYRGQELVLGDFRFIDDQKINGALFAALRFSDHPRAIVRKIDPAPALKIPGVHRVITAADVPGERRLGLIIQDWPILVAIGETTRCIGDVLAIVVAENQRLARRAAAALRVDYEVLDPITTPEDALRSDAPKLHPGGNLLSQSVIHHGEVQTTLASSAHVVEGTYETQRIEHLFLEPEACLAVPTPDHPDIDLLLFSQGQGVFDDRRQIASMLGWKPERLRVELVSTGGAFGGKEDMSIQAQTALAAVICGRPVKCTLTRLESFRLHPKRHPMKITARLGCDEDGRLTALQARIIGDTGAYASVGAKVLERAACHATGPYRIPNVDIEARAIYTNNPPAGAMRGFGVNQAAFAIESLINLLATRVGLDGWEIRWRNALEQGDRFCTGQILDKPFGLKKTLEAVREAYRNAKYAGIACGIKNVGIGNGMPDLGKALISVDSADRITIRTGFTEMGQGLFTVCVQVACEETSLPPDYFTVMTDTSHDLNCGQTTASRGTVLAGQAVREAARKLKADLDAGQTIAGLIGRSYRGDYACTDTTKLEANVPNPKTHLTYGFATQVVILDDHGTLHRVIAAHDVGRVINPTLLEGQIQGSVHMGLGYALTEELVVEGGHIQNPNINSLGVLRAHHMPEVEVILIEEPDPETPYGARGVGEIGLVPTAPAVAGALEAFDGIHRRKLPMRDSPAARALLQARSPSTQANHG